MLGRKLITGINLDDMREKMKLYVGVILQPHSAICNILFFARPRYVDIDSNEMDNGIDASRRKTDMSEPVSKRIVCTSRKL